MERLQPETCNLHPNQKGISSLVLLFAVVLGVFIIWETNEYIGNYTSPKPSPLPSDGPGNTEVICDTGEAGNCNDSNDVFIFTE